MPRSDGCTTNAKDLFDLSTAPLDEGQREKVVGLLDRMPQVFATRLNDLGRTTDVEHEINVTDKVPFKETYRRVAPGQMEEFAGCRGYYIVQESLRIPCGDSLQARQQYKVCVFSEIKRKNHKGFIPNPLASIKWLKVLLYFRSSKWVPTSSNGRT